MQIQPNSTRAANAQDPQNNANTPAENDPEKFKQTLKDGNSSAETNMQALQNLRDSYDAKIKSGGATQAEKDQFTLIDDFLSGSIGTGNIQSLSSSLGMNPEKLNEVANLIKGPNEHNNSLNIGI